MAFIHQSRTDLDAGNDMHDFYFFSVYVLYAIKMSVNSGVVDESVLTMRNQDPVY